MGKISMTLLMSLTLLVSACGGGSSTGTGGTGTLSIGITDAPVLGAENVVIHFTNIQLHSANGTTTDIPVIDPVTKLLGRSIDLMQLQGDKSLVLFDTELESGNYSWMRLDVDFDPDKTYINVAGQQHALRCISCQNNGYKLNRSYKVEKDSVMAYTVDFDLQKSITLDNKNYHLRPTLRVVETAAAGHLGGDVDETLIASLGGESGCIVYVYDGTDTIANDIYLPEGLDVPDSHHNPVATALVEVTTHTYTAGYLPAGNYTVALTCDGENDDILTQDAGVTFHAVASVTVEAGKTT